MYKVVVLLLTMFACTAHADTVFNYDGFFARMKKSEQPQYSDVTLTFVLQKQATVEPCQIEKAKITTDISEETLTVAANGELILPYEQVFNDRKALIRLVQSKDATACDLNFRLRNKMPLGQTVKLSQLRKIHQQFAALLNDLAGLGKYFLPQMTGITLQFANSAPLMQSSSAVEQAWHCQGNNCHLDLTALPDGSDDVELKFSQAPEYLFPYIPR